MKKIGFTIIILMIVFIGAKAYASGRNERDEKLKEQDKNAYYLELEERYTEVIRHKLESDGYINAGITVTSVITAGAGRDYTVRIHHDRFEYMTEEEVKGYEDSLEGIEFPDQFCTVNVEVEG